MFKKITVAAAMPGVVWICSLAICVSGNSLEAQSLDSSEQGAIEVPDSPSEARSVNSTDTNQQNAENETAPTKQNLAPVVPTAHVGRRAAQKYMAKRREPAAAKSSSSSRELGSSDHYLALGLGTFVSDNAYFWGKDSETNVGKGLVTLTYRVGEWVNSMDLNVRVDYQTFQLDEGRATKLSFLPLITFPDASSRFPLYFGIGGGPGVFLTQIPHESAITLDYELVGGARFFNLVGNTGAFIEAGLKNHINLLSDGQFNGTFIALGAMFTF